MSRDEKFWGKATGWHLPCLCFSWWERRNFRSFASWKRIAGSACFWACSQGKDYNEVKLSRLQLSIARCRVLVLGINDTYRIKTKKSNIVMAVKLQRTEREESACAVLEDFTEYKRTDARSTFYKHQCQHPLSLICMHCSIINVFRQFGLVSFSIAGRFGTDKWKQNHIWLLMIFYGVGGFHYLMIVSSSMRVFSITAFAVYFLFWLRKQ